MDNIKNLVQQLADAVEKVAWSIPAPNPYTPQLIQIVQAARREDLRVQPVNTYQAALAELVQALDNTTWSSWQTTAEFQDQLDAAHKLLNEGVQ